jgi:hypothetical protein
MALESEDLVVAASGRVYVGPVTATLPTDESTPLDSDFVDLGYLTDAGVTVSPSVSVESVQPWQSFYSVREIVTARELTVAFELLQFNAETTVLAFGGGTVTEEAPGSYKMTPPSPEVIDKRTAVIEWADGDKHYRLVLPVCMVSEAGEFTLSRSAPATLSVTLKALGVGSDDPFVLYTDDPSFAPTGS